MKITLPKSRLSGCLSNVLQVVPTKSTLPILSNLLVEALDNKLKVSATDLDISISASIECEVIKKGSAVLPARILFDIVKEMPESEVSIESTGTRVELKIPNGNYKIAALPPEDFPKLPVVNTKKEIKLGADELTTMIRKTTFACSDDETRPALNGVLWQTKGDKMQMVATDGHRLAKIAIANKKLKGLHDDVIIPPKVLNLIPKFVLSDSQDVGVIFGENNIIFNLGDVVLTSRLIDGPYPNFDQVIPSGSDKKVVIGREELAGAVKRVSILSNALTHQVKFSVKDSRLVLSSTNADVGGEGKEELKCDYKGEPMDLGYNANYVTEIVNRIEGEDVILELTSATAAGVLYSPEVPKDDFLCLLMPLRLAE
jgi:DNA polymerase-3 subunit beta